MATPAEMDANAEEALKDAADTFDPDELAKFAAWWKKWYPRAGHKRLGRGIVEWWG